jgi:hypothetical protein
MLGARMTDDEINTQLAELGFDRRWVDLGVLTEDWIARDGQWRLSMARMSVEPPDRLAMLRQALFNYLYRRKTIDDAALAGLLDIAARTDEDLSRMLAAWQHCTAAQLAQIVHHDASALGVRRLAAQRLRVQALEAGADVAVNLVGFSEPLRGDGPDGDRSVFEVGHRDHPPAFRFRIAWEQPLTADPRRRVAALLAALPDGEEARCHHPVFGLRLDPGTPDELRMSICFQCNNIYLDGGGRRRFEGQSAAGGALLDYLLELAPRAWSRQVRDA